MLSHAILVLPLVLLSPQQVSEVLERGLPCWGGASGWMVWEGAGDHVLGA